MNKKGFAPIAIILIIIGSLITGSAGFVTAKNVQRKHAEEKRALTQKTTPTSIPSDWKTYRNEKYGFVYAFPMEYKEQSDGHFRMNNGKDSITLNVIPRAVHGYKDFIDGGARGKELIDDGGSYTEFLNLTPEEFTEQNYGTYKVFLFENTTFSTSLYALVVKGEMSILFGFHEELSKDELSRGLSLLDTLKTNRREVLNRIGFVEPAIDTSTWKTYRNEKHGFQFKYPPIYSNPQVVDQYGVETNTFSEEDSPDSLKIRLPLSIDGDQKGGADPLTVIKNQPHNIISGPDKIIVGGKPAERYKLKWNHQGKDYPYDFVVIKADSIIYTLSNAGLKAEESIFNAVLSTFIFTEPKVDISDWKTYRNEKYGFEFKYPAKYSLRESSPMDVYIGEQKTSQKVEVFVKKSVSSFYSDGLNASQEVVKTITELHCMADGPGGEHYCKVTEIVPFKNVNEELGYKIYATHFYKRWNERGEVLTYEEKHKVLSYVFMDNSGDFAIQIGNADESSYGTLLLDSLIDDIAKYFQSAK